MPPNDRLDRLFAVLSDHKRRQLIRRLEDDREVTVGDSRSEMISMVHVHLPKLANHGYVRYDDTDMGIEVSRGPRWREAAQTLSAIEEAGLTEA